MCKMENMCFADRFKYSCILRQTRTVYLYRQCKGKGVFFIVLTPYNNSFPFVRLCCNVYLLLCDTVSIMACKENPNLSNPNNFPGEAHTVMDTV